MLETMEFCLQILLLWTIGSSAKPIALTKWLWHKLIQNAAETSEFNGEMVNNFILLEYKILWNSVSFIWCVLSFLGALTNSLLLTCSPLPTVHRWTNRRIPCGSLAYRRICRFRCTQHSTKWVCACCTTEYKHCSLWQKTTLMRHMSFVFKTLMTAQTNIKVKFVFSAAGVRLY